jgi:hypothetical protein
MSDAAAGGHLLFAQQTITTVAPSPASAGEVAKRLPRALPATNAISSFVATARVTANWRRHNDRHYIEPSLTGNTTGRIVQPPA